MRRPANTLMEMLISIAVIGVMVSMLVPAVQKARESANRVTCANNLRQLSLGIRNYENNYKLLPPGYQQVQITTPPPAKWCGNSWYALILPYVEQDTLLTTYDYKDPFATVNGRPIGASPTSAVISSFMCPSDQLPGTAFQNSGLDDTNVPGFYAPSSYVGNTGTMSFPLNQGDPTYNPDGILNVISPSFPVSIELGLSEIPDGQSYTVLLGERFHFDPVFDLMPLATIDYPISNWSAWGWVGGIQASGHVLGSAQVPLNYKVNPSWTDAPGEKAKRLAGFGSAHSSGCQFALCDGSVICVRPNVDFNTLKQLCSRNDGPPTGNYE